MIKIRIDLAKITESRVYLGKNGARYLNAVLIERREPDQYGNTHSVKEDRTKEEREAGKESKFIGDAKDWSKAPKKRPDGNHEDPRERQQEPPDDSEPVPF